MPPLAARSTSVRIRAPLLSMVFSIPLIVSAAHGAPTVGFTEHWPGTSVQGWSGGSVVSNPGTGGVLGAGDGYLTVSNPGPNSSNLGSLNNGASYAGDWQAAGITQVRFWLKDVGAADPLEIHFLVGNGLAGNFWQYDTGFIPSTTAWTRFTVNLTSSAGFTHVINATGGTFDQALQNVDRILIRHDLAPYIQIPDSIIADVGIDELTLSDGITGVDDPGPARVTVAGPLRMAPPYPNPSQGPVVLSLETFEDTPIRIQVLDVTGRVVRQTILAGARAGPRLWTWDGAADDGEVAPAGVYRVRAFGPSGGMSRALVRLGGAR